MNTQPTVLLYNFNDPDRLRIIRRYLNRQKVKRADRHPTGVSASSGLSL